MLRREYSASKRKAGDLKTNRLLGKYRLKLLVFTSILIQAIVNA